MRNYIKVFVCRMQFFQDGQFIWVNTILIGADEPEGQEVIDRIITVELGFGLGLTAFAELTPKFVELNKQNFLELVNLLGAGDVYQLGALGLDDLFFLDHPEYVPDRISWRDRVFVDKSPRETWSGGH
jgi:hypothetical protein